MVSKPLKTLKELHAFDGEKGSLEFHRDAKIPKCSHKNIKLISGSEMRCSCGAGWYGPNITAVYNAFINRKS